MSTPPEPDSVELFVDDLRRLWREGAQPKFMSMANRTGVSKTSLNDAVTRRDRLPSQRVVSALVGELAPEMSGQWETRRAILAGDSERVQTSRQVLELAPADGAQVLQVPEAPHRRTRTWLIPGLIGFVVGALMGAVGAWAMLTAPAHGVVNDGDDPAQLQACLDTAITALAQQVPGVGSLRLVYSANCHAYWAKIVREDGKAMSNRIEAEVFEKENPSHRQQANEPDATSAYTYLLVRGDASSRFCATGRVLVGDTPTEFGPLC